MTTGSLRYNETELGVIHIEDSYTTTIDDLWSALTEPERLARWVCTVDGDPRLGTSVHAHFTSSWDGILRIDVCDRPTHLLVTSAPGTPDEQIIEAVLTEEGSHTRLVIEERGFSMHDLPFHGAGWQAHVEDLAAYLTGRDASDWRTRWEELIPAYQELSAELSA
jgi:uncharacterized protein YndB with AHSA1/START domain